VREGQPIAILDSTELRQQVALQKAESKAAEADLAELLAGNRPEEIEQGRAALAVTKYELERAGADYRRARELYQQGIVSVRDFEIRQADFDVAQAKLRWPLWAHCQTLASGSASIYNVRSTSGRTSSLDFHYRFDVLRRDRRLGSNGKPYHRVKPLLCIQPQGNRMFSMRISR